MNIALIAPTEIPARRANTLQVMKMAQAFSALDLQVHVISPKSPLGDEQPLSSNSTSWEYLAQLYGLEHPFTITWLPANPNLRRYDFCWRAIRYAQRHDLNVIYTRLPQAAAFSSQKGYKTVYEIHDFPQGMMGPALMRLFLGGRGAQRLVVITQALYDDLRKSFKFPKTKNFTQIAPDGVDLERYQDLPKPPTARRWLSENLPLNRMHPFRFPENFITQFTLGYTGHLYPGRGTHILVELAAHLPMINFLIVGGEPQDVKQLQQIVASRQLNNFLITGFMPNADLPRFQAACDALLMPYQETVSASSGGNIAHYLSPMKLFEYMACQRAILSSNLPVLQEILNPQNAILLPPNDIQAWIEAIIRIQKDPELRNQLGKQAREDVAQYTWQARASRILEGLPF
jgi:glycosyltransferase involved in cell wall biosynthesis